jgi:hypothetical protein
MSKEQPSPQQTPQPTPQQQAQHAQEADDTQAKQQEAAQALNEVDGLSNKKPEELTPEELRLMADTMPGEGPGD